MVSCNHDHLNACVFTVSYCGNGFFSWRIHYSQKACECQILFKDFYFILDGIIFANLAGQVSECFKIHLPVSQSKNPEGGTAHIMNLR